MHAIDEDRIRAHYHALTAYLIGHGLTITTMESITAGQIASLITDTEGASAVLKGAFVTYSNEAKVKQGVSREIIDACGVYSRETAGAMARACQRAYQADIAVGITGSTGNIDPNNADSVPGQVFYAIAIGDSLTDGAFTMERLPSRLAYKLYAAEQIVQRLFALLP